MIIECDSRTTNCFGYKSLRFINWNNFQRARKRRSKSASSASIIRHWSFSRACFALYSFRNLYFCSKPPLVPPPPPTRRAKTLIYASFIVLSVVFNGFPYTKRHLGEMLSSLSLESWMRVAFLPSRKRARAPKRDCWQTRSDKGHHNSFQWSINVGVVLYSLSHTLFFPELLNGTRRARAALKIKFCINSLG